MEFWQIFYSVTFAIVVMLAFVGLWLRRRNAPGDWRRFAAFVFLLWLALNLVALPTLIIQFRELR